MFKNNPLVITIVVISLLLIFGFFNSKSLRKGPIFEDIYHIVDNGKVLIEGKVTNYSFFTINDKKVYPDENGNFIYSLHIDYGYIIIELYAENRKGRGNTYLINLKSNYEEESSQKSN